MSSVCMKYPICLETKGALLLKFHFHTPPPLPLPAPLTPCPPPIPLSRCRRGLSEEQAGSSQAWALRLSEWVWTLAPGEGNTSGEGPASFWGVGPLGSLGWPCEAEGLSGPSCEWVPMGQRPWQGPAVWDGNARSAAK